MKTPEEWEKEFAADPVWTTVEDRIRRIQDEAYHEGQLAGLKIGKETAMKTISEVFSKPAE